MFRWQFQGKGEGGQVAAPPGEINREFHFRTSLHRLVCEPQPGICIAAVFHTTALELAIAIRATAVHVGPLDAGEVLVGPVTV